MLHNIRTQIYKIEFTSITFLPKLIHLTSINFNYNLISNLFVIFAVKTVCFMSQKDCVNALSEYLFWDIDKSKLDIDASYSYIIQRVLEFGEWKDWCAIRDYFGIEKIVFACKNMRSLDPKALAFIAIISNTDPKSFKCYTSTH